MKKAVNMKLETNVDEISEQTVIWILPYKNVICEPDYAAIWWYNKKNYSTDEEKFTSSNKILHYYPKNEM